MVNFFVIVFNLCGQLLRYQRQAEFLQKYKYPTYDDFYTMLRTIFNDNQRRYLIPKNIANDAQLEELVDNMLRAGFAFCGGGNQV